MAEFNRNLWAPWRMAYLDGLSSGGGDGCFLCRYRDNPQDDEANGVLWRGSATMTLLNRFPYTSGHLLITPAAHVANLDDLPEDVLHEMSRSIRDACRVLRDILNPQGFNIGMNVGKAAGAGLPDHLHWHVVPRWGGDGNFLSVVGDVRTIPQMLETVYARYRARAAELGL